MGRRTERHRGAQTQAERPPFVDRHGTLASLVASVSEPAVVLVSGEAGAGKSRLVAELREVRPSLVGRCYRLRDPFPLGPIVHVLRALPERALRGLPASAGALLLLVPELAASLPPLPAGAQDPRVLSHLMFRGIEAALRAAGPAVLVIEDAHWIDEQTLELLDFLVSDPVPWLSVVVTFRNGEVDPAVPALAARAGESLPVSRITLSRWDVAGTGQLAAAMLGIERVSPEFAEHLWQRASGLPLAIRELVGLLVERGTVAMHDGEMMRRGLDELEVPAGLRDPVLERVSRLPRDARALVEAGAVLQRPADRGTLAAVARLRGARLARGLLAAETSGLLVEHEGAYEVSHVLAAEAVHGVLSTVRREILHRRAATALRSAKPCPLSRIAHHEREARVAAWPDTAEAAANQALVAGDDEAVIVALEPVLLESSVPAAQRARALVMAARASIHSPRGVGLLGVFEAEVARDDGCLDSDSRVRVAANLSQVMHFNFCDATVGTNLRALATAEGVSDDAGLTTEALVLTRWLPGRSTEEIEDAAADLEARCRVADLGDGRRWQLRMMIDEARLFTGRTNPHQLDTHRTYGPPTDRNTFIGHLSLIEIAATAGDLAFATRLLDLCDAVDDPSIVPSPEHGRIATIRLEVDFLCGHWADLLRENGDVRPALSSTPSVRLNEDACSAALSLAVKGPTAETVEKLDRVLAVAAAGSLHDALVLALTPRIRAALATGETADLPGVDRFLAAVSDHAIIPCLYQALPEVTALLLARGEGDRAQRTVAVFAGEAERIHAPLAPAAVSHARGLLELAGDSRSTRASELLGSAADRYGEIAMTYEAARARQLTARVLPGTDPMAEQLMALAMRTFRELGATWDLDRARQTARTRGWTVPGPARVGRPAYGGELSPRERDVAELAAQGLTNDEIAQRLYVSVHTVRKQVAAALHKLGLDSRRQLARHLAGTG
ncbi:ATP-binding protein [Actinophytocola sediminis]